MWRRARRLRTHRTAEMGPVVGRTMRRVWWEDCPGRAARRTGFSRHEKFAKVMVKVLSRNPAAPGEECPVTSQSYGFLVPVTVQSKARADCLHGSEAPEPAPGAGAVGGAP